MKKLIIILACLTVVNANNTFSNVDTIRIKSKITDVTVFFNGAQITRNVDLKVGKGNYLMIADKLPNELNPQSIQVNAIDKCIILSVKHEFTYPSERNKGNEVLIIENEIEAKEIEIKGIKNRLKVYELEEKLLLDNSVLGKNREGSSMAEIKEAADFYRLRLNEIRQGKLDLSIDLQSSQDEIRQLYAKLNELTAKKRITYSQILITLSCEKEINSDLSFSYYISSAGWNPLYDFRVDEITKPLVIVYNANVYQSSGEDWSNVNMKLSTSDPSLSGSKPELINWYLGQKYPYTKVESVQGLSALFGRVSDLITNEALAYANVSVYKGNELLNGTTTDLDGYYLIKPLQSGKYNVKASYLGYKTKQSKNVLLSTDKVKFLDIKLQASAIELAEVQVVEHKKTLTSGSYECMSKSMILKAPTRSVGKSKNLKHTGSYKGMRYNEDAFFVDGTGVRGVETSNYISNSLKTTVANLEYIIEIPYTIPSSGKDFSIKIKKVSLPVDYVYHAVPKLDNDVFLTAHLTEWNQLNLLSGKSNIYYQGTYIGESDIDADQADDTLNISLGRDKSIIVKRKGNKEVFDKRIIGGTIKESVGWDITVKNNKDLKIRIYIEDQFPVSENKSINVEKIEYSNAKLNEKTGKMTWELELEPNEKRVLNYKYSVKYPKYINLGVE